MDTKARCSKLLRVLAEERASHGHGAAATIDRKLHRSEGYLGRVLRGEIGLQVEMLFQTLDILDVDAEDFFARAIGTQVEAERLLARMTRQSPAVEDPLLIRAEANLHPQSWKTQGSSAEEFGQLREHLESIDDLRFSDPEEASFAIREALEACLDRIEAEASAEHAELLCQALGVMGSIARVRGDFYVSARTLHLALVLARKQDLVKHRARLLQRTSYLIGDQGEYDLAILLTQQASDLYTLLDDRLGLGKSLVDRGIMLFHAGRTEEAQKIYEASLQYLSEDMWQFRAAVFQGLGQIYTCQGRLAEARESCEQAMRALRTKEGPNWWRLIWLQGEISLKENSLPEAKKCFSAVRRSFSQQSNPLDYAVASLRLAKVLLMEGRTLEVQQLAGELICLLRPLRKNKLASAAIHELARAALTGKLNEVFLDKIYRRIRTESSHLQIPDSRPLTPG